MQARLFCIALLSATAACAPVPVDPQETVSWTTGEQEAIETARDRLADYTGISPQLIGLVRVEATQWPDTSLGCAEPGQMYAQVITSGHVVTLKAGNRSYNVHVAGDAAVVCEPQVDTSRLKRHPYAVKGQVLEAMEAQARADLAAKLSVTEGEIRYVSAEPRSWPDGRLGCGERPGLQEADAPVDGFVLTYEVRQRLYRYHTDLERVFACPPVDLR